MDLKLENKIPLVTGSTEGIGFAIAKILAQEGVKEGEITWCYLELILNKMGMAAN